jgi:hypothetical protein
MFATFIQKTNKFPGLPDSLFELSDPVRCSSLDAPRSQTRLLSTRSGFYRQQDSMRQRSKKTGKRIAYIPLETKEFVPMFIVAD